MYIQDISSVCSLNLQNVFRVYSEYVQALFRVASENLQIRRYVQKFFQKVKSGKLKEEKIARFIPAFNDIEEFKKRRGRTLRN